MADLHHDIATAFGGPDDHDERDEWYTTPNDLARMALLGLADATPATLAAWADESGIAPQLLDALLARLTPEAREAALIDGGWVAHAEAEDEACNRGHVWRGWHGELIITTHPMEAPDVPLYRFTMKGANDG